jgi:glycosyltransferase involved in cell wall biosynthesis
MERIAIVVQRYGSEVNGGAELHARLLVQALKPHYEVDVLTSRALDYVHWAPHYPAGEERIDGCHVLRFDHPPRERGRRRHLPLVHKLRFALRPWLVRLGIAPVRKPNGGERHDGLQFLRAQGPAVDGLITHLRTRGDRYAALIFLTARFFPTAMGVLVAPGRSLLVPTLHDEKAMVLPHFHAVFRAPHRILYNTAAEKALAERLYGPGLAPGEVCGVGIDMPAPGTDHGTSYGRVAARHGIAGPFLLYVGRVDANKGCGELFEFFARLLDQQPGPLQLVVCGKLAMPAPAHPRIVLAGFVADDERDALLAHAEALVVPSRHESLSLVLLESLALGCPVIVNAGSEVLRQHVADSGVGMVYDGFDAFAAAVTQTLRTPAAQRQQQAARGRHYVAQHYDWKRITVRYRQLIDEIVAGRQPPSQRAT